MAETTTEEQKTTSDKSVVRSTGSMAVATLMSRITGFIRTVMITSALGGAVASAFNTANTLPNLITEIVFGAVLTSLVVPVLVRAQKEDPDRGEAFVRRLDVIIEFDEPDEAERLRLWRSHFPERAPVDADVNLEQLAGLYPVTGGVIRNAMLTAAFRAAEHGGSLTQAMLIDAVRTEYDKSGRSFPGAPARCAKRSPNWPARRTPVR